MAATGLTFLQIINRVLARLREDSVSAHAETTYSSHVGAVVNQVKAEIEEAYTWLALRDTYSVTTSQGVSQYALTSSGMNSRILDAWDTTSKNELRRGTNAKFNRNFFASPSLPEQAPTHYLPAGLDNNYDMLVDIWPVPNAAYDLKFNVFTPQADLAADGTVPLVPQNVLIEETIARMLVERGEETAPQPAMPGTTFLRSDLLAAAVAREAGHDDSEMDWEPE